MHERHAPLRCAGVLHSSRHSFTHPIARSTRQQDSKGRIGSGPCVAKTQKLMPTG